MTHCITWLDSQFGGTYLTGTTNPIACNDLFAYPNPFVDVSSIQVTSPSAKAAILVVQDLSGRLVDQRLFQLAVGANTIVIAERSNYPSGTYLISIRPSQLDQTVRVVKVG